MAGASAPALVLPLFFSSHLLFCSGQHIAVFYPTAFLVGILHMTRLQIPKKIDIARLEKYSQKTCKHFRTKLTSHNAPNIHSILTWKVVFIYGNQV